MRIDYLKLDVAFKSVYTSFIQKKESCQHAYIYIDSKSPNEVFFGVTDRNNRSSFKDVTEQVRKILSDDSQSDKTKRRVLNSYIHIQKGFKENNHQWWLQKIIFGEKRTNLVNESQKLIQEHMGILSHKTALSPEKEGDVLPTAKEVKAPPQPSKQLENLDNSFGEKNISDKVEAEEFEDVTFLTHIAYRGDEANPIRIPIANCRGLNLKSKEGFREACTRINERTINIPYPAATFGAYGNTSHFPVNGQFIFRPGHNGTHSGRQVRYGEVLLDLLSQKNGSYAEIVKSLTADEIAQFKLALFCLGAGRANDLGWVESNDDFYLRSALVYEEYASQFTFDPPEKKNEFISMMKDMIQSSAVPMKFLSKDLADRIKADEKLTLFYHLTSIVHRLDLQRVKDAKHFEDEEEEINFSLKIIGLENYILRLVNFAGAALRATGVRNKAQNEKFPLKDDPSQQRFAVASHDAKKCFEYLDMVKFN